MGEDVENILVGLLQAADYDVPRAERGILYLDEVDKIARKSATPSVGRDVSGEGVQQALLKILEGTTANIPPKGGRKHPEQPMIQMDTRNILFVCGGAFEGLDKVISQRVGKRTMGFGADGDDEHNSDTPDVLPLVQPEDLLAYGMIPEFVGRVPVITTMDALAEDDLFRILTEPHDAIIKQSQRLFARTGRGRVHRGSPAQDSGPDRSQGHGGPRPALRLRAGHDGHHVRYSLSGGRDASASYGRDDRARD